MTIEIYLAIPEYNYFFCIQKGQDIEDEVSRYEVTEADATLPLVICKHTFVERK